MDMFNHYVKEAAGFLVVYSIVDRESFDNLGKYKHIIDEMRQDNPVIVLCGNKLDLAEEGRQVSQDEAEYYAHNWGCRKFLETSAKTRINIEEAFFNVVREYRNRQKEGQPSKQKSSPKCVTM